MRIIYIYTIDFSSDGIYIATGSADNTVRLLFTKKLKLLYKFTKIHSSPAYSVKFDPSVKYLATGDYSGIAKLINI